MARINKCIELLEQDQPIYLTHPRALSYDAGLEDAKTWADLMLIDFEHRPFDVIGLTEYMRGLKDGGPTASGHPTPPSSAPCPPTLSRLRRSATMPGRRATC